MTALKTDKGKLLILHHTFPNHTKRLLSILIQNNRMLQIHTETGSAIGNIYIGKVKNVAPQIDACFVEIMPDEICFLPLSDALNEQSAALMNRKPDGRIIAGDELLVQVVRDAIKSKQPAVTTRISFSGKYTVLSAGQKHLGVSGKIPDSRKKEIVSYLLKEGLINEDKHCIVEEYHGFSHGFIIRTNAGELTDDSLLKQEWLRLEEQWQNLLQTAPTRTCYSCLYQEIPSYVKSLRDLYDGCYDEIITDNPDIYETLHSYMSQYSLGDSKMLRLYEDPALTLENLYGIPSKLEEALGTRVRLKSGGYLVIEPTEALNVIDVNSGKYESKKQKNMPLIINTEAAIEIARQIKLRNLSGIIIVDFINMKEKDNETLMTFFRKLLKEDSVPTEVIDMTPLGLVEITRKKINSTLKEQLGYTRKV